MHAGCLALGAALLAYCAGCGPSFSEKARNGITFYCPGAGNTDFGDAGLRAGLERAGYRGEVATYLWTISFNVALDQTLRFNARLRAAILSDTLKTYIDQYVRKETGETKPQINLVGLSAGTGVAIWSLEDLPPGYYVDNVVLLGSSLWCRYDVSKALQHVKGKIYVYYSPNDAILAGPMKLFGTIDGVFNEDGAGAVGLRPPKPSDKIINIPWKPAYGKYGYHGGHTDSTNPDFVAAYLSKHLLPPKEPANPVKVAAQPDGTLATGPAKAAPGGPRD